MGGRRCFGGGRHGRSGRWNVWVPKGVEEECVGGIMFGWWKVSVLEGGGVEGVRAQKCGR